MNHRPDSASATMRAVGPLAADPACRRCEVRHLAFCAALDSTQLNELHAIVEHKQFKAGETPLMEGDEAGYVFNLVTGAAKLYKLLPDGRCQITGFLLPGDFFGVAHDSHYSYSAETLMDVELCRFPRRKLELLFDRYPKLEKRLLGIVSHELSLAQDQMLLLGRRTAIEKVGSFLLDLSRRAKRLGWPANPIHLPMSRQDIADFLGLTIETVSRTFTTLKSDGIIALPKTSEVEVRDLSRLEML